MTQQDSSGASAGLSETTIQSGAARGYIKLSGPDSRKFLQGQVTCDIDSLTPANSVNGAHCTPKGRMVFLFSAHCDKDDNIILQTHPSIVDIAIASLKKYAVFFKTEISDISDQYSEDDNSSSADLERLRAGIADVVAETSEMFIPQMLNLDALGYISFKKGCYTGQEIVARAHYRGAVKRRMHHLQFSSELVPQAGDEIKNSEGQSIGNIASALKTGDNNIEVLAVLGDKFSHLDQMQIGDQPLLSVTHLPLPYEIPSTP
jgi:folate-binding protein YgfZ